MRAALGLAAAASTATAIMIPSTVSVPELNAPEKTNLKTFGVDPHAVLMKVDCMGCNYAQRDASDNLIWSMGTPNALVLNISTGEAVGTLELNGVRFYPPLMNFAVENPVPYIPQIPAEMTLVEVRESMKELEKEALRLTSWSFTAAPAATVSESGDELLTIHLQMDALEREPITVPDIAITALKNSDGELSILRVEMQDKEQAEKEECESWPMMCKIREMINKFKGMKPSFPVFGKGPDCSESQGEAAKDVPAIDDSEYKGWKPGQGPPPWVTDPNYKGWRPGSGGPPPWAKHGKHGEHPHPPHHGDGEHKGWVPGSGPPPWVKHGWKHHGQGGHGPHKFHRAMHVFGRIMLTVIVPILLGVAAGMVTYLIGMIVGAVIVAIYMKIRGRREKYSRVALEEEVEEFDVPAPHYDDLSPRESFDEKEALMAPPEYVEKE